MPIKAEEHTLYAPGNLIQNCTEIYSVDPNSKISEGTVGLILERGEAQRLRVQFTGNITWWVYQSEVEPYLPTWREYP
jgi:hypothetical protein